MMLYVKAGHFDQDPGTSGPDTSTPNPTDRLTERQVVVPVCQMMNAICDKSMITHVNFDADWNPDALDSMTLYDAIQWINKDFLARHLDPKQTVGIDVHCDYAAPGATGVKTIYRDGDAEGQKLAQAITDSVATSTGLKNLGTLKDTATPRERLGFLRDVKFRTVLIELGFISNDLKAMKYNPEQFAAGILRGFGNYYGVNFIGKNKELNIVIEYAQMIWNKAAKGQTEQLWTQNACSKIASFARSLLS